MVYSDNRTLNKLLTPDIFQALRIFAADRGIAVEAMNRFKPGLVMISFTMIEAKKLGAAGTRVNEFFFSKAVRDKKNMGHLESPEEQISLFEKMGTGNEDALIAYILEDLKRLPELLPVIKTAWKKGAGPGLDRAILGPLKHDFPQLYHALFVARNQKWMPGITQLAATPQVEFILVGAGLLAGEQGLLALLKNQGFTITNQ